MRFHPKSLASTDHAPGPNRTNAAPIVASRMFVQISPCCAMASHRIAVATMEPATGVHRPATRRTAPALARTARQSGPRDRSAYCRDSPWTRITLPATMRRSSNPRPGPPCAKVVNRRRRSASPPGFRSFNRLPSPKRVEREPLLRSSGVDDSAFDPDHGGMGPIVCAQLGEDVLHSSFYGFFGDGELRGDLLVRVA